MRPAPSIDDDPPPRRLRLMGDMKCAGWRELRTTAEIRREGRDEDPALTPGQRVRRRRNLVILLCHEIGLSSRQIGEIFGMGKTRITAIIEEMRRCHVSR